MKILNRNYQELPPMALADYDLWQTSVMVSSLHHSSHHHEHSAH